MNSNAPSTATSWSGCRQVSQWIQSVSTVTPEFLRSCLVGREAVFTTHALRYFLRLHVVPLTIQTAVGTRHVIEVRSHDQPPRPAFGTDQVGFGFKIADPPDMSAGEMMNQTFVLQVGRSAVWAARAEGRHTLAP